MTGQRATWIFILSQVLIKGTFPLVSSSESGCSEELVRHLSLLGDTLMASSLHIDRQVENMKRSKVEHYLEYCQCAQTELKLCQLLHSKFYQARGHGRATGESRLEKIASNNFAVN